MELIYLRTLEIGVIKKTIKALLYRIFVFFVKLTNKSKFINFSQGEWTKH